MKLLYYATEASGGLADYAREQTNALALLGVELGILSSDPFLLQCDERFKFRQRLITKTVGRSKLANRLDGARTRLRQYRQLSNIVAVENYRHVILNSYAEYMAPLWSWRLTRLAHRGVVFGAVVHDPVRDYVVGPLWWHRRSVADAYSFLREALVHEPITLNTVRPMPRLRTTVIPHGTYSFPPATATRENIRRELEIPDTAEVWLSFGHVRDGKNLDLVIRALACFPHAHLLVAGKEQSSGQKPVAFYRSLAQQCGVSERCHWLNRFIPADEVGNLFAASDLVLLTYSSDFRSASGVLNAAIHFHKPCLASSGQGNLQTMISRYNLGIWVKPDNLERLIDGLRDWRQSARSPLWEAYKADNSWRRNAKIVVDRIFESPGLSRA